MTALKIARGLTLGADAATKTFAILAQRRKGKTYTASVIAEEMVAAEQPWVALDPTGAWWGLRASADGKKAGLPVYVFGGQHGDVPLERTAGKLIADLVVDEPSFYVLDLSAFESKNAERQFATDFAERFYRRKARSTDPIHLFVDEADVFTPQRSPAGDQRMLGAFEAIVRRGGIRGIGTTLISQRAAVVNKNVLEQIDVLIALRTVGPRDRKALSEYIEAHGTDAEQAELMGSIASLALGEAWIWEPGGDLFKRVRIRERRTFNSSATPKAGERRVEPRKLADVDLDALRGKIEATIEKAKADDPKALRKQVAELKREITAKERELAERPTEPVEVEKPVEVPVLANGTLEGLQHFLEGMGRVVGQLERAVEPVVTELARVADAREVRRTAPAPKPARAAPLRRQPRPEPPAPAADGDVVLDKAMRAILTVLVQYPEGKAKRALGLLAGYSPKGGGFNNALSRLRTAGLISSGGDPITAASQAADLLGEVEPLPTGRDLLDYWLARLGKAEREILTVLHEAGGESLTKEEIAERTESAYSASGGGFNNALSGLRTRELVDGRGELRAADVLFEESYV